MQIDHLIQGIEAKFDQSRLVFWYDPEQSFHENLSEIVIDGVTVLDVSDQSVFETKKRIELDQPAEKFLLYFPYIEPDADRDWLLDVRLYSEQFFADASSMLLNELSIPKMSLRSHIHDRQSFFANKQRFSALKRYVTENEDEDSLDLKMIAVVTKADSASLNDILLCLFKDYSNSLSSSPLSEEGHDAPCDTRLMTKLTKFNLTDSLWSAIASNFSYVSKEPSIADFVLKLFCTELWSQIDVDDRDWLLNNVLKTASGKATALAFMTGWRDSRSYADSHDVISKVIGRQLEVASRCAKYHPDQLLECETFEEIEQSIIRGLVMSLLDSSASLDRVQFNRVLSRRLSGHWCLTRNEYTSAYEALRNAELLIYLRKQYVDGFHYDTAQSMYGAYIQELYKFDQAYRLFNDFVHTLFSKGAEILRQLDDEIENLYTNWYLYELSTAWDSHIGKEKLMENWKLADVQNQYQFYDKRVKALLSGQQTKRVFVIISDAMRFEVAHELTSLINSEKRFKAELDSQLGVLPSYTQLGMASLLPNTELSYQQEKGAAVYVDGLSSQGLDKRNAILQKVNGIAVSAKDLIAWSNQEGRDRVKDAKVVYIYHDTIDAVGDKSVTEDRTFEACRNAIDELVDLVTRVINRLNASRVVLTADHGFLFRQKALESSDRTDSKKPDGAIVAKKRYIVGDNLSSDEKSWKGRITDTANGSGNTGFLLPKGVQRFHFVGGAKFVHGGAMLQEVCVPVVSITALRGEKALQHEKKPVGVVVSSQPIKIVNNIDKLVFIQTDPVNEHFIARQLDIYILDQNNNEVSSRETVNFDGRSTVMDERTRDVRLKLIGSQFDRNASYTLVLENIDTRTRYNQYSVTIDLAFQDDFF
jgi:uncharacterized protein (TIGR02687 family)